MQLEQTPLDWDPPWKKISRVMGHSNQAPRAVDYTLLSPGGYVFYTTVKPQGDVENKVLQSHQD